MFRRKATRFAKDSVPMRALILDARGWRLTPQGTGLIVGGLFKSAKRRSMEIRVEGSLDQAMRVLKRKLAKEGVFKEMKKRAFYEKPSVRRKRKRSEAQRRRRKEQRRRRASAI
jgi:small subunit ribosomal protein S21